MKKTFLSALRALCVGAMTLAAVSCYDDSFLNGEIEGIKGEVADLAARVDALEQKINSDVSNVGEIEAAVSALEKSFNEAIAANKAEVEKSFEDELAALKKDLEAAIAAGDKANADALAKEKEALEAALKALQTTLTDGLAAVTGSVEDLEAALKALEVVVGANYKALLAEMDKKDGVIDGEITKLEEIVAELQAAGKDVEAKVVEALAKIAVISAKEVDGKIVITFADGSSVEVSKPLANVDNNGLVTIVTENGVKYWQVVGAETHTGVVVGHPDQKIEFRLGPVTGELEYRVNESEWIATGVKAEIADSGAVVVTGFEDKGDYIELTIGGVDVVLPKVADFTAAKFNRSELYHVYGATKTVTLTVGEGQDFYLMAKPDGWKAKFEENVLTVTAPAEELVKTGVADAEGQVLVHVNNANGDCSVVTLDVTVGPVFQISYENGNLSFLNAGVTIEEVYGEVFGEWNAVKFGVTPLSVFIEYGSFENYLEIAPDYDSDLQIVYFNALDEQYLYYYSAGVYEEFTYTLPLESVISGAGMQLDPKETYVFWATTELGYSLDYANVQYFYIGSCTDFMVTEASYNNVLFNATLYGSDSYIIGAVDKTRFAEDYEVSEYELALSDYLIGSYYNEGPLTKFNKGDMEAMGEVLAPGAYALQLEDVILSNNSMGGGMPGWPGWPGMGASSASKVSADTEYFVWILPYSTNRTEPYTFEDLIITSVKTEPMVENSELKAALEITSLASEEVVIKVTPVEGVTTHFELCSEEQFNMWYCDEEGTPNVKSIIEGLKESNFVFEEEDVYEDDWLDPETKYIVIIYDEKGGEYSLDYSLTFTTPEKVVYETPAGKQWIIHPDENPEYAEIIAPYRAVVDFGSFVEGMYYFAVSQGDFAPEDPEAQGIWMSYMSMSIDTVEATSETSGVISLSHYDEWQDWTRYLEIPYSNYTGTTCTIDFTEVFGFRADCVLSEESIEISAGIAM